MRGAEHGNFVDPLPELHWVVVEERHRFHLELRVPLHFPDHHGARIAGADDQDALALCNVVSTERPAALPARRHAWLLDDADRHPDAADDQQRQKGVENEDRTRELLDNPERQRETDEQRDRDPGSPGCEHDGLKVANGRIAPVATIQAEPVEDARLGEERDSQKGKEFRTVFKEPPVETQDEGSQDRSADGREVGEEHVAVTHGWTSEAANGLDRHRSQRIVMTPSRSGTLPFYRSRDLRQSRCDLSRTGREGKSENDFVAALTSPHI